jgi:hypothetical protein
VYTGVPRNLLIRFKEDSTDDSNGLAQLLQVGHLLRPACTAVLTRGCSGLGTDVVWLVAQGGLSYSCFLGLGLGFRVY